MYTVEISNSEDTLSEIIELRYSILRKPWHKNRETVSDDLENESVNAYIKYNNQMIACGRLQNNGNGIGQIRFMAISKNYQRKGLGKILVRKLEEEAHKLKLKVIHLQARETAVEFYKAQGYTIKEKSFLLWDIIQHYLMIKEIKING
ncbi:MAG: GNAT family N-acetyltransferase [Bacteroidota bacterium]